MVVCTVRSTSTLFQNPKEVSSSLKKMKAEKIPIQKKESEKSYGFFQDVFDVVKQIPRGRVSTYGAIAKYLGTGMSARMVGWAMNASHQSMESVPAHRVVNRNGVLTGKHHFSDPSEMERLLNMEGIEVKEDQITDFKNRFWDPAVEISI
jgi:methylated-DNA-protein-cysteine methyltransferase related protein